MREYTIHISPKSLVTITLFAVAIYILSLIWHTLLLIFVALIFATLIEPFAKALQKRRIPRALAALIVYVVLFGVIGISLAVLMPVVARDLPELAQNVSGAMNDLKTHHIFGQIFGSDFASQGNLFFLQQGDGDSGNFSSVFSSIGAVFGGIVSFVIVLVITFYLVIQDDPLRKVLTSLMPEHQLPFTLNLIDKIREKLGQWMRGQLILSLIVGLLTFFVLTIFGIKYAAVIALLAGLFEMVPYVGPIFASLPALFFAFNQGGLVTMTLVLASFVTIQQFENHVLIPKVMQKAVGLNPIISIIALIIGLQLGGVLGGVLAIPVATTLQVVVQEVMEYKKIKKMET